VFPKSSLYGSPPGICMALHYSAGTRREEEGERERRKRNKVKRGILSNRERQEDEDAVPS
jgi:hypothetical protein